MPSVAITWTGPPAVTLLAEKPAGGFHWIGTTTKKRVVLRSDEPGHLRIALREAIPSGAGYVAGATLPAIAVEFA